MRSTCCHTDLCVQAVPVFKGLAEVELAKIAAITESSPYSKGSIVFREGEPADSLYVLNNGLMKLSQISHEGKQHNLRFLFPGDYFGQFDILQNKQHYATAEMLENGRVCRIHRKDLIPLIKQNADLAYSFLMTMSEQLRQAEEWAGALHILDVDKRLAKLLLHLYSKIGLQSGDQAINDFITLPAAKKEIAAMIGTTPETLSRKLNFFEENRIIEVCKRNIHIRNIRALNDIAEIGLDEVRNNGVEAVCT